MPSSKAAKTTPDFRPAAGAELRFASLQIFLDQRPGLRPGLFCAKWNFSKPYILVHIAAWRVDRTRAMRCGTFDLAFQSDCRMVRLRGHLVMNILLNHVLER